MSRRIRSTVYLSKAVWETIHYQALLERTSVSALVGEALIGLLERRGTVVTTLQAILDGQVEISFREDDGARDDS